MDIGQSPAGSTISIASSLGVAAPSPATVVKKASTGKETGDEPQHLKVCAYFLFIHRPYIVYVV